MIMERSITNREKSMTTTHPSPVKQRKNRWLGCPSVVDNTRVKGGSVDAFCASVLPCVCIYRLVEEVYVCLCIDGWVLSRESLDWEVVYERAMNEPAK